MTKEEAIKEVGRPLLKPIGICQILCLMAVVSTPFIAMWHSWSIAWRVGLTGLFGVLILGGLYLFIKKIIVDAVDKEWGQQHPEPNKSKFRQKMEKMTQEQTQQ